MRNLSSESSAQSKNFNLKRVLFCRGNHGRLFQQNRPKGASRMLSRGQGRFKYIRLILPTIAKTSQSSTPIHVPALDHTRKQNLNVASARVITIGHRKQCDISSVRFLIIDVLAIITKRWLTVRRRHFYAFILLACFSPYSAPPFSTSIASSSTCIASMCSPFLSQYSVFKKTSSSSFDISIRARPEKSQKLL